MAKVVAVHYAGNSGTRQAFGISRDAALDVVEQLKAGENVDSIGVNGQAVSNEDGSLTGIWVSSVQSGSQADQAGVKPGDILTMMESLVLATDGSMSQYCDILRSHEPGDTLSLEVLRWAENQVLEGQLNGRELAVTVQGDNSNSNDSANDNTNTNDSGEIVNPDATASGDFYYYSDFDGDLSSWTYFLMNGSEDGFSSELVDGKLRVEINDENTWVVLHLRRLQLHGCAHRHGRGKPGAQHEQRQPDLPLLGRWLVRVQRLQQRQLRHLLLR